MTSQLHIALALCVGASCFVPGEAPAARWALTVGVDAYEHAPRLGRAASDAAGVAAELRARGFQVKELQNPTWAALDAAVRTLSFASITAGDEVVVYFAGRAVESTADCLLLARDARPVSWARARGRAQSAQAMLGALALRRPRMALLIIDGSRTVLAGSQPGQGGWPAARWTPELEPGQIVLATASSGLETPGGGGRASGSLARELIARLEVRGLPIDRLLDETVAVVQRPSAAADPGLAIVWNRFGSDFRFHDQARETPPARKPDVTEARRIVREAMRAGGGSSLLKVAYREALNAAPDYLPALIGLGMLAEADGDWPAARNYFEWASMISVRGAVMTIATEEARALRRRQDGEAEPESMQHTEYDDAVTQARLLLAAGDARAAVGQVERALAIDAARWEAYAVAGQIAIALDRMPQARRWFGEAHQRAHGPVRDRLARVMAGL